MQRSLSSSYKKYSFSKNYAKPPSFQTIAFLKQKQCSLKENSEFDEEGIYWIYIILGKRNITSNNAIHKLRFSAVTCTLKLIYCKYKGKSIFRFFLKNANLESNYRGVPTWKQSKKIATNIYLTNMSML